MAQSNWLVSSTSSFSETAAGVGLGPQGVMERYGFVNQNSDVNNGVIRRDWENGCSSEIFAADHEESQKCPNHGTGPS